MTHGRSPYILSRILEPLPGVICMTVVSLSVRYFTDESEPATKARTDEAGH